MNLSNNFSNSCHGVLKLLSVQLFLCFLKHANFLIGNSSAGIHEAPIYGVPTINLGTRQQNRFHYESIIDLRFDYADIINMIDKFKTKTRYTPCEFYGKGKSAEKFMNTLKGNVWSISNQTQFKDLT